MEKKIVGLDLPSVLGMGISGPVLAFLTATLYTAFKGLCGWNEGAYAVIMLVLSAILAAFPASKAPYKKWLKVAVWPIATVMIFSSAWGSSTGMSAGEDALSKVSKDSVSYMVATASPGVSAMAPREFPRDVPMAPSSTDKTIEIPGATFRPMTKMIDEDLLREESVVQGGFFKRLK
jgi:hypothetical protein